MSEHDNSDVDHYKAIKERNYIDSDRVFSQYRGAIMEWLHKCSVFNAKGLSAINPFVRINEWENMKIWTPYPTVWYESCEGGLLVNLEEGWLTACVFGPAAGCKKPMLYMLVQTQLSDSGEICFSETETGKFPEGVVIPVKNRYYQTDKSLYTAATSTLDLIVLCCRFLGFKNVSRKEQVGVFDSKFRRSIKAQGQKTLGYKYYVLTIRHKKKEIPTYIYSDDSDDKSSRRLHSVRGHIKRYTKEKPHCSGFIGEFFCPPHARGMKDTGVIDKDYKMQAEAADKRRVM